MPYNLYVTRPSGKTFKTLRSPYPTRGEIAATVRTILAMGCPMTGEISEFAGGVVSAPLSQTLTHETTGVGFRTEVA